jgi:hypothetical protein
MNKRLTTHFWSADIPSEDWDFEERREVREPFELDDGRMVCDSEIILSSPAPAKRYKLQIKARRFLGSRIIFPDLRTPFNWSNGPSQIIDGSYFDPWNGIRCHDSRGEAIRLGHEDTIVEIRILSLLHPDEDDNKIIQGLLGSLRRED